MKQQRHALRFTITTVVLIVIMIGLAVACVVMGSVDIPADAVRVVLGGTSAIDALDEGFGMQDEGPVYDLQGRKMANGSLKAGIYVKNGRKIIVK